MSWKKGDKVKIRSGSLIDHRGTVHSVGKSRDSAVIEFEDGSLHRLPTNVITNFSAAARKAWKTMPDREVGRPFGTRTNDRISVTFRIDRTLWQTFREREASGAIQDRSAAIEEALASIVSKRGREA